MLNELPVVIDPIIERRVPNARALYYFASLSYSGDTVPQKKDVEDELASKFGPGYELRLFDTELLSDVEFDMPNSSCVIKVCNSSLQQPTQ